MCIYINAVIEGGGIGQARGIESASRFSFDLYLIRVEVGQSSFGENLCCLQAAAPALSEQEGLFSVRLPLSPRPAV